MGIGDISWFAQALADLGTKQHDLSSDNLRLGIIRNTPPAVDTPQPHWGGTGSTDLSAFEVARGTSYVGPIALTGTSWVLQPGGPTLRADIIQLLADANGFTDGYYGVIFNNSDPKKRALAFVNIQLLINGNPAPLSLVTGPGTIDWNGATNDILELKQG